ncbi:MAG: substrate-binding domain-containing protein [Ruminococcus sp.]|nr:substrate-binding domain-containing protein [Ruminococcus sp.]
MEAIGRIGVIIPQIIEQMEYELMYGIHDQAKKLGYDVLIFTDTYNPWKDDPENYYVRGLQNIYHLAYQAKLDGILFAAGRLWQKEQCERINTELRKLSIPCLVLDMESMDFPHSFAQQKESVRMLTEHLIREHGCKKLYCITGMKGEFNSDERAGGFRQAMEEAGLPVDDSMIFDGYFWRDTPRQIGRDIAAGIIPKPDGVVCVSDVMATSLCLALEQNGMSVPDDVAVTGYDGCRFSYTNDPPITTVSGREFDLGRKAISQLHSIISDEPFCEPKSKQYIQLGTSCGCAVMSRRRNDKIDISAPGYIANLLNYYFGRKQSNDADFISKISDADSLEQLTEQLDHLAYMHTNMTRMDICLCDEWMFDFENPSNFRKSGYPENMKLIYSKNDSQHKNSCEMFPTEQLLPMLEKPHEPSLIAFTSLHRKRQIFGYVATAYEKTYDMFLSEYYLHWCDAIANGLANMQKKLYRDYLRQQMEALSIHDSATGLYNRRGLLEHLPEYYDNAVSSECGCVCMLLSYIPKKNSISVRIGVDMSLMIANAIRLSADDDELYSRLSDNVFALILKVTDGDITAVSQRRLMELEDKLLYFQGAVPHPQLPDLVTDCTLLKLDKISEADEFLESRRQNLMTRMDSAVSTGGSLKDQLYSLRRRINSSPQNDWFIPDIAESLGVSSSHFQRTYKSEFGVSCMDDVIYARIEKAKKLLLNTDLRIQEVSDQCGYANLNNFMRQFKKHAGMTATQFKLNKGQ